MSITDELRNYTEEQIKWLDMTKVHYHKLLSIASRIDAEHEKAITAAHSNGITEYGSMVSREYVKLPVDADGEVIHLGDRVENNERVVRIVLTDGSCEPSVYVEMLPNVLHERFCNEISHYHEPTVEDVLTKMLEQAVGYSDAHTTVAANAIAEYAAKLRLAGDAE